MNTLIVKYDIPLSLKDIPQFRGAILTILPDSDNVYFHNHNDEKLRYSYPLIQYKCIDGLASIVFVGEGTKFVGSLFSECKNLVQIGKKDVKLDVLSINYGKQEISKVSSAVTYVLKAWLPLNKNNFNEYHTLKRLSDKCSFLEKILIGNVLSLAKGIDINIDFNLEVEITDLQQYNIKYKDIELIAFDIEFLCNAELPEQIGLGKSVSKGYGMLTKKIY